MRLTAENKEKVRKRILKSSAEAFRAQGVDAVSLDDLMKGAGLTRGAFYAHFKSKGALLAEVLRHEHPLLRMLQARDGETPALLHRQMRQIFTDYLDPAHLEPVFEGCTLAALTGEAARADALQRQGFEAALDEIATEMMRGREGASHAEMLALVVQASGAVNAARACHSADIRAAILTATRADILAKLG